MNEQSIMERLKLETTPQHQQAERQELERELISGTIPKDVYTTYLGQRLFIHHTLDNQLATAASVDRRVKPLLADGRRFHANRIAEDLQYFGVEHEKQNALPETVALTGDLSKTGQKDPIALLGFFYVFEGSTNGARYIARALRKAWGLTGSEGTRYLDPYGEEQRGLWDEFKNIMNATEFTPQEQDEIVAAARRTFEHMVAIDKAIYQVHAK